MQLTLIRTYHKRGTNGLLHLNGTPLCFTIELPWRDNLPHVSCIPEGSYPLVKRFNDKRKNHLLVQQVPGRSLILIHPANNAEKQLQGCIAPVTTLTGQGCGDSSQIVFNKLIQLVYPAIEKGETVMLIIHGITK